MSKQLELDPAYYAVTVFQNLLRNRIIPYYKKPFIFSICSSVKVSNREFQALSQLEKLLIDIHASFHWKVEKYSGKNLSFDISRACKIMHTCGELDARQEAAKQIVNALNLTLSNSAIRVSRMDLHLLRTSISMAHNVQVGTTKLTA